MAPLFDADREVIQLHLGGGTPNFLATSALGRLLGGIGEEFSLSERETRDFSIEIDPRFVPSDASLCSASPSMC